MIGRSPQSGTRLDLAVKLFWIRPATVSVWPSRSSTVVLNWRWVIWLGTLAPLTWVCRGAGGRYAGIQLQADPIAVGDIGDELQRNAEVLIGHALRRAAGSDDAGGNGKGAAGLEVRRLAR